MFRRIAHRRRTFPHHGHGHDDEEEQEGGEEPPGVSDAPCYTRWRQRAVRKAARRAAQVNGRGMG